MPQRWRTVLHSATGVFFFAGSLWLLWRSLRRYSLHEILANFQRIPPLTLAYAVAGMLVIFGALFVYEWLALIILHRHIPARKVLLASFLSTSFSHTIGFPMLIGGATRLHLYGHWGFTSLQAVKVMTLTWVPATLGFLGLCGIFFTTWPMKLPPMLHLPVASLRLTGILLLAPVAGYILASLWRPTLRWRQRAISVPSFPIACAQLLAGMTKWGTIGVMIYVLLLGEGAGAPGDFGTRYCLAQTAAVLSHTPGGLGVFDAALVYLLKPAYSPAQMAGVLLAYRAIYNLLPLVIAIPLFFHFEWRRRRAFFSAGETVARRSVSITSGVSVKP